MHRPRARFASSWLGLSFLLLAGCRGEPPSPPGASGLAESVKLNPAQVRLAGADEGRAMAGWALFDRSAAPATALGEGGVVEVSLRGESRLSRLKIFGAPQSTLTVETEAGEPLAGLKDIDLSALPLANGWNSLDLRGGGAVSALRLRFAPRGESAESAPSELELWGEARPEVIPDDPAWILSAAEQTRDVLPPHLVAVAGEPAALTLYPDVPGAEGSSCGAFSFTLEEHPALFRKAYLVYEAKNLFRPFSLERSLNGQPALGGFWLTPVAGDSTRFVEELDPETLRPGVNELAVCLPDEALGRVSLQRLSFFGELENGHNLVASAERIDAGAGPRDAAEVLDGDPGSVLPLAAEQALVLHLDRLTSPEALSLDVARVGTVRAVECLTRDSWTNLLSGEQERFLLSPGENVITLPAVEAGCAALRVGLLGQDGAAVQLREVEVIGSGVKERVDWPELTLRSTPEHFGGVAYLSGFVRAPGRLTGPIRLTLDGKELPSFSGVFDKKLTREVADPDAPWDVEVTAAFPDGSTLSKTITLHNAKEELDRAQAEAEAEGLFSTEKTANDIRYGRPGETVAKKVTLGEDALVRLGTDVGLKIPAEALAPGSSGVSARSTSLPVGPTISITQLPESALPPWDATLINVTAPGAGGYEFLPHGQQFQTPVEVEIPYDPALIPAGATTEDIRTYFYNEAEHRWEALPVVGIDTAEGVLTSATTHFTVMANAVLAVPETQSPLSYNPNELSSLAAASPAAGIDFIEPPSASQTGDANLSYPIRLPPGRGAYSPSLALTYSSGAGNGWLGVGWNLAGLSKVEIDSRWGVPDYDFTHETADEKVRYLLDGEALVPTPEKLAGETAGPGCRFGGSPQRYRPRVEGAFAHILRCVQSGVSHWEIYDRDGTFYLYGSGAASQLNSHSGTMGGARGPFAWHLEKVEDIHGNVTTFTYAPDQGTGGEPWTQIYPSTIQYTSKADDPGVVPIYEVRFHRDNGSRDDPIITARPGFKVVTRSRLRSIEVVTQGIITREYVLTYDAETRKSLLRTISVYGEGGVVQGSDAYQLPPLSSPSFFYLHSLGYYQETEGFAAPEEWPLASVDPENENQLPPARGLTSSKSLAAGGHLYVGVAWPFAKKKYSAGLRGGLGGNVRTEEEGFYDLNGDGLPDLVFQGSALGYPGEHVSALYNHYRPGQATPGAFKDIAPPGDIATNHLVIDPELTKLGRDNNFSFNIGIQAFIAPLKGAASFSDATDTAKRFMTDVNGDGLLDQVRAAKLAGSGGVTTPGEVLLSSRCEAPVNKNKICFRTYTYEALPQVSLANSRAQDLLDDLEDIPEEVDGQNFRAYPISVFRRWVAPYPGEIVVDASFRKLLAGGEDGVTVYLHHNDMELTSIEVTPGSPDELDVKELATGLPLNVETGDAIYLRVSSNEEVPYQERTPLDAVDSHMSVVYTKACEDDGTGQCVSGNEIFPGPEELAIREPTGAPLFVFDSEDEFRLAGAHLSGLPVPGEGVLEITGTLTKSDTPDDIRVCVKKYRFPSTPGTPFNMDEPCRDDDPIYQEVPAEASAVDLNGVLGTISNEILAGDILVLRVDSDFSIDPDAVTINLNGEYTWFCDTPTHCHAPDEDEADALRLTNERFQPYFPIPARLPAAPRLPLVAAADGSLRIYSDTAPGYCPPAGTILAFRSDRQGLLYKKKWTPTSGCLEIDETYEVTNGESIWIEALVEEEIDVPGAQWMAHIDFDGVPQDDHDADVRYPKPEDTNSADVFSGGYHQWQYGMWNGRVAFSPSFLLNLGLHWRFQDGWDEQELKGDILDENEDSPAYQVLKRTGVMRPLHAGTPLSNNERIWAATDAAAFIGARVMHSAQFSGILLDPREPEDEEGPADFNISANVIPSELARFSVSQSLYVGVDLAIEQKNINLGRTFSEVDALDINGDGILDMVSPDGWIEGRIGEVNTTPQVKPFLEGEEVQPARRESYTTTFSHGLGINAVLEEMTSGGARKGATSRMPTGASPIDAIGFSIARSRVFQEFTDLNGDGLPDLVRYDDGTHQIMVRYNLGDRLGVEEAFGATIPSWGPVDGFNATSATGENPALHTADALRHDTTKTISFSLPLGAASTSPLAKTDAELGASLNFESSATHTVAELQDLNGDGLPDLLFKRHGQPMKVRYNLGGKFSGPATWNDPSWGAVTPPDGILPAAAQFIGACSAPCTMSKILGNYGFSNITGPDVLAGTGRYSRPPSGLDIGAYLSVYIPIPFFGLKFIINPGINAGISLDSYELALADVNGDGAADHLLRVQNGGNISLYVKKNLVTGKEYLLHTISRPLGSQIELDYTRVGNTYEMPQSRHVLSRVTVDDQHDLGADFASPDLVTEYEYEDGFYDRAEKEFYGFARVTTRQRGDPGTTNDDLTVEREYENRDYVKHGELIRETSKDGALAKLEETLNTYDERVIFADTDPESDCRKKAASVLLPETACDVTLRFLTETTTELCESICKTHRKTYGAPDTYGNLLTSLDEGEPGPTDDLFTEIEYLNLISDSTTEPRWILGLPGDIWQRVGSETGALLRHRKGFYDDPESLGDLTELAVEIESGVYASTSFEYDDYGNLVKVELPSEPGELPQGLFYEYDALAHTYQTRIEDNFGYHSEATYDLRFGLPETTTDTHYQTITRTYDGFGRLTAVVAPYSTSPAVSMTYDLTGDEAPKAVTTYHPAAPPGYSGPVPGDTVVVTFVDGLGRPLEVLKTAVVEGVVGRVVQGPPKYDARGRVVVSYQPTFSNVGGTAWVAPSAIRGTESVYDARGRVLQTIYPDATSDQMSYDIAAPPTGGTPMFKALHTAANGNQRETYTDLSGNTVAFVEYPDGAPVTTRYSYDALGQLTTITDAATPGNVSTFTYDLRGLQTSLNNPDTGLIEFTYDVGGNLIEREEPNHREGPGVGIRYTYDRNRLVSVDYPSTSALEDVVYTYGPPVAPTAPESARNAAGRVVLIEDEFAPTAFQYGRLGEVRRTTRTIRTSSSPVTFETQTTYDSMGRMLALRYPDGEVLQYTYDAGGKLTSAVGTAPGWTNKVYVTGLQYDVFGNRRRATFGNGLTKEWTYNYDRVRLQRATTTYSGTKYQDLVYQYDDSGNPTQIDSQMPLPSAGPLSVLPGLGQWSFSYDGADRLRIATGSMEQFPDLGLPHTQSTRYAQEYFYDAIHNVTSKTRSHYKTLDGTEGLLPNTSLDYEYNYDPAHPHRIASIEATSGGSTTTLTLDYDDSGNLTHLDELGGPGRDLFWDDRNRLVGVTGDGIDLVNYYDAAGTRVFKQSTQYGEMIFANPYFDVQRVGTSDPQGFKHVFADGMRVASHVVEYDPENPPAGAQEGRIFYFLQDHLGSTNLVTMDGTPQPRVVEHLEYFADGDVWIDQNSGKIDDGYRFTGKFQDPETGFYDFGARFYDPKTGIWLGVDPLFTDTPGAAIGRPIVLSTYKYGNHSPIRFTDPDGKDEYDEFEGSVGGGYLEWTRLYRDASRYMYSIGNVEAGVTFGALYRQNRRDLEAQIEKYKKSQEYKRKQEVKGKSLREKVEKGVERGLEGPVGIYLKDPNAGDGPVDLLTEDKPGALAGPKGPPGSGGRGPGNFTKTPAAKPPGSGRWQGGIDELWEGKQALPGVGEVMVRQDAGPINSPKFISSLPQNPALPQVGWEYIMETWRLPNGATFERHYFYHAGTGWAFHHD